MSETEKRISELEQALIAHKIGWQESTERNAELKAQVEQLQKKVFELQCFDIDVIRCLKTLAFEHNHEDIPRYQPMAKECMAVISAGNKAKELKAQAVEDAIKYNDECNKHLDYGSSHGGYYFNDYLKQLRQAVKES